MADKERALRAGLWPRRLALQAPLTDIPTTYAEWQLFVPSTHRLSGFDGNMTVARGTTHEFQDAWQQFLGFYAALFRKAGPGLLWLTLLILLVGVLIFASRQKGWRGVTSVFVVFGRLVLFAAMLLPALSKAKAKAQGTQALHNLKQIALAAQMWANDRSGTLPLTRVIGMSWILTWFFRMRCSRRSRAPRTPRASRGTPRASTRSPVAAGRP